MKTMNNDDFNIDDIEEFLKQDASILQEFNNFLIDEKKYVNIYKKDINVNE
jgi:hypothetical protein